MVAKCRLGGCECFDSGSFFIRKCFAKKRLGFGLGFGRQRTTRKRAQACVCAYTRTTSAEEGEELESLQVFLRGTRKKRGTNNNPTTWTRTRDLLYWYSYKFRCSCQLSYGRVRALLQAGWNFTLRGGFRCRRGGGENVIGRDVLRAGKNRALGTK